MKKLKTLLKKGLALTLAIAVTNSYSNVSADTVKEAPIVFNETVELSPLKTFDGTTNVFTQAADSISLIDGTAEKWIDRIQLPEEAKKFYAMLEEGVDNDGEADILIDDSYFSAGKIELMNFQKKLEILDSNTKPDPRLPDDEWNDIKSWVQAVVEAFDRDHPEVFWLSGDSEVSYSVSSYGTGNTLTCTYVVNFILHDDKYDMRDSNYQSADSIKKAIVERDAAIETICSGAGATPVDKIKHFNQWLTRNNEYNTNIDLEIINNSCRECISALTGSEGTSGPVCEGYARAFKVLCDSAEIPCVLVDGNAINSSNKGEAHMWNYVKVDDSWYGVDVTWDDPKGGNSGKVSGVENENYLLVGANSIPDSRSGLTFLESHPVENQVSSNGIAFINGPVLSLTEYKEELKIVSNPILTGTYGDLVKDMTLEDGEVTLSGEKVAGTWTIVSEDQNKLLSVGTEELITVVFKPEDTALKEISAKIKPVVTAKSLKTENIIISLKETSYIYDGTEKKPVITVNDGNIVLAEKKDYNVSYKNNVNAGTAEVSITGIGNYADNVIKTFSIEKANSNIIVEQTIEKTFGEEAFPLNAQVDNDLVLSYQTDNSDIISVDDKGIVTIKKAGTANITISAKETENYNAPTAKEVVITVKKADISAISPINKTYLYTKGSNGNDSMDLSKYFPGDIGSVTYSIKQEGTIISETPVIKENILEFKVSAGNIGDKGSIIVTASSDNYSDLVITINFSLSEQKQVELKADSNVSINNELPIYGDTLSKLTLNNAEFVEAGTDTIVEGTLSWKDSSQILMAGDSQAIWVFTPNSEEYSPLEGTLAIKTQKATPVVTAPTTEEITYHPAKTLEDISLNGSNGTWLVAGKEEIVKGTWTWKINSTVPTVENTGYIAVFTPNDDTNYNQVETVVSLIVKKATPVLIGMPTASAITYGETLADSILTSGGAVYTIDSDIKVSGNFVWKNPEIKPTFIVDNMVTEYTIVFTPTDENYNTLDLALAIVVNKAEKAPEMPQASMEVENNCQTVSDITLDSNWNWQEMDRNKELVVGQIVTAAAIYIGSDKGNYKEENIIVEIVRLKAEEKPPVSDDTGNSGDSGNTNTGSSSSGSTNTGNSSSNSSGSTNTGNSSSSSSGSTTIGNSGSSSNGNLGNTSSNVTTNDNTVPADNNDKKEEDKNTVTDENKPNTDVNNNASNNSSSNNNSSNNNSDKNQSSNSSNTNKKDKDNNSSSNDSEYKTVSLKNKQTSVLKINDKKQVKLQVNQKKEITSLKYKAVKSGKKKGSIVAKLYKNKKMAYKVQIKPVGKKLTVVVLKGKNLKIKYSGKKAFIRKNGKTLFTVNLKTS